MDCKTSQVTNYLRLHASRMSMDRVIHNSSIWFVRRVGNVNTFMYECYYIPFVKPRQV